MNMDEQGFYYTTSKLATTKKLLRFGSSCSITAGYITALADSASKTKTYEEKTRMGFQTLFSHK